MIHIVCLKEMIGRRQGRSFRFSSALLVVPVHFVWVAIQMVPRLWFGRHQGLQTSMHDDPALRESLDDRNQPTTLQLPARLRICIDYVSTKPKYIATTHWNISVDISHSSSNCSGVISLLKYASLSSSSRSSRSSAVPSRSG